MKTIHAARWAVHQLRKQRAAGTEGPTLRPEDVDALVAEFDRMRTLLADSWNRAADKLAATPHDPSALTGPPWYGRGWDDAVDRLRDLAEYTEP
ncbi:hypothetical protein ACFVVA_38025 [Kitasatospora sp. NPDC058048]|uniref:hypothetical protein n=1 Tax=Kitasatospora sp. NPDC058048 TaxID=3346313 RepID=UPI0036DD16CD